MESAMRRRLGKRVWKAILWLLLFSLAGSSLVGILYQVFGSKKGNYFLQVNGIGISRNELAHQTRMLQETIHMIRSQAGEYADFVLMQNGLLGQPQALAQDRLVARAVALDGAQKSGIKYIAPSYAAEKLDDPSFVFSRLSMILPSYLFQGYGKVNRLALEEFFRRSPELAAQFDAQYDAILKEDLFSRIIEGVAYAPRVSAQWKKRLEDSVRVFGLYTISKDSFVQDAKARVTDEILQDFFKRENAQRRYWSAEKRAGMAWKFSPEKYGLTVSDVALRRYFADHNKTEFKDKTFDAVKQEIYQRLLKDQFKKLFSIEAKSYTSANTAEGFKSFVEKKNGVSSKINLTSASDAKDQLGRVLFSIVRVGARSFFIDDKGQGIVVELTSLDPSSEQPFETVKDTVRADWISEESARSLSLAGDELLKNLSNEAVRKDLIKKYRIAYKQTSKLAGNEDTGWETLAKDNLPAEQMKHMGHVGYGLIAAPNKETVTVVALDAMQPADRDSKEAADTSIEDANNIRVLRMVVEKDVLAVLKESAKIKQYKEEKTTDISSYLE